MISEYEYMSLLIQQNTQALQTVIIVFALAVILPPILVVIYVFIETYIETYKKKKGDMI